MTIDQLAALCWTKMSLGNIARPGNAVEATAHIKKTLEEATNDVREACYLSVNTATTLDGIIDPAAHVIMGWQVRNWLEGGCASCSKPREPNEAYVCADCYDKHAHVLGAMSICNAVMREKFAKLEAEHEAATELRVSVDLRGVKAAIRFIDAHAAVEALKVKP